MHTRYLRNYAALVLLSAAVVAAADNEDDIARCAAISSADDRIRCLEEALRRSSADGDSAIAPPGATDKVLPSALSDETPAADREILTGADTSPGTPVDVADQGSINPGAVAASPGVAAQTVIEAEEVVDESTEEEIEQAQRQESPASSAEIEQFGLSLSQRDPQPLESIDVSVVSVDTDAYGKLIFTTASGQVWRQTDRANPRYRQIPFDAEIRKGAMGSFFIKARPGRVAVRVKRSR